MKPFQILDLPNEEYHGSEKYWAYRSRSRITRFIRHGRAGMACERRGISLFAGNAGTSLGTVVDEWLDAFASDHAVHPADIYATPPAEVLSSNGQRRGAAYKAWEEEQLAAGKKFCSEEELKKASIMADSILNNPVCMDLIERTVCTQRCIFWKSEGGHMLKIRSDGDDGRVPWDLKTTSAPVDMFPKKAIEYGYHHQAALYLDGFIAMGLLDTPLVDFKFLVVQSIPPYRAKVMVFPQKVVDFARKEVYDALDEMRDAEATPPEQLFDSRDLAVEVMDVPPWLLK